MFSWVLADWVAMARRPPSNSSRYRPDQSCRATPTRVCRLRSPAARCCLNALSWRMASLARVSRSAMVLLPLLHVGILVRDVAVQRPVEVRDLLLRHAQLVPVPPERVLGLAGLVAVDVRPHDRLDVLVGWPVAARSDLALQVQQ